MKKLSCLIALASVGATVSYANAQDYSAQIDALQNELLKIKQEMSKGGDNKAYFKKGKGLSVISADGKYSFQIKVEPCMISLTLVVLMTALFHKIQTIKLTVLVQNLED